MEKPVHTLSFSMSYPQYRDYYLYQISIAKNRPVWLVPELFLGAGVLGAVASLLFRRMAPVGFLPGFPLATEMVSLICVAAYSIVRLGWLFRIRRKSRRQYRLKRLGKQKSQIRLYQDFVTVHYPSAAFDSFYEEISSIVPHPAFDGSSFSKRSTGTDSKRRVDAADRRLFHGKNEK